MSQPTHIDIQLFSQADAQQPPPVEIEAVLMPSRDMGIQDAGAETPVKAFTAPIVDVEPVAARQITVGVIPLWGVALGVVLVIVGVSQAIKSFLKAIGTKERVSRTAWRRWMYVVPVGVGITVSGLFGPQLGELFGFRFGVVVSMVLVGPSLGAVAAFTYDVFRGVILPIVPATVIGMIEKVSGITLPDSIKANAHLDQMESEVGLEERT